MSEARVGRNGWQQVEEQGGKSARSTLARPIFGTVGRREGLGLGYWGLISKAAHSSPCPSAASPFHKAWVFTVYEADMAPALTELKISKTTSLENN